MHIYIYIERERETHKHILTTANSNCEGGGSNLEMKQLRGKHNINLIYKHKLLPYNITLLRYYDLGYITYTLL